MGLAGLAVAGLLAAAGCTGGGIGGSGGGESLAGTTAERAADADGAIRAPDTDGRTSRNRPTVQTRAVISIGEIRVTSPDVAAARDQAEDILAGVGGYVASEQTTHDEEGVATSSRLTVRVPAAAFADTMEAFEALGKLESSEQRAEDVTTELIDVTARVQALEASVRRLESFLRESADLKSLIRLESAITTRQAELDSLRSQQSYLEDQTSMSTIRLHLSTPKPYVQKPEALEDAGFLAGLEGGWQAMKIFLVAAATTLGAVLPFVIALALVGVPVWLLVRRRAGPPVATEPPAPEPPAE